MAANTLIVIDSLSKMLKGTQEDLMRYMWSLPELSVPNEDMYL